MSKTTQIEEPSYKSLFIQMKFDSTMLSIATAFIVYTHSKEAYLITNRHNVTGKHQDTHQILSKTGGIPNEITIFHNKKGRLGQHTECTEKLYNFDGSPLWIEHPTLGSKADFVALKLTQLQDVDLYPYSLDNSSSQLRAAPAEPVSVIGFPFGFRGEGGLAIWATGFIASEPELNFEGLPIVLIDCRTRKGQSGSPVLSYKVGGSGPKIGGGTIMTNTPLQRFIGIYSGRINEESDIGKVWKASAISELISSL